MNDSSSIQIRQDRLEELFQSIPSDISVCRDAFGWQKLTELVIFSPYLSAVVFQKWDDVWRLINYSDQDTLQKKLEEKLAILLQEIKDLSAPPWASQMTDQMRRMRQIKRLFELILAFGDFSGLFDPVWAMRQISLMAEYQTQAALSWLLQDLSHRGRLTHISGNDPLKNCGVFIIAMGKLGGYELNYSSDIDLIFIYDSHIMTSSRPERLPQDMVSIASKMGQMLEQVTADGIVFRTDYRLRPDPAATPLAISFEAALVYYGSIARNWERQAYIKARTLTGDIGLGALFFKEIFPFIWRRSLDYEALKDLRKIKNQISHDYHEDLYDETIRAKYQKKPFDVKKDQGGIREIEFLIQSFQLIWGGRIPSLQVRSSLLGLENIKILNLLDQELADQLRSDYIFLRGLEHRLQMMEGNQTHLLPAEPELRAQVAIFMGWDDLEEFEQYIYDVRIRVSDNFSQTLVNVGSDNDNQDHPNHVSNSEQSSYYFNHNTQNIESILSDSQFINPKQGAAIISGWLDGNIRATHSSRGKELLQHLIPKIIKKLSQTSYPDNALKCFDEFLKTLNAGILTLSLLHSQPNVLKFLCGIIGNCPSMAHILGAQPGLLEVIIQPDSLSDELDEPERIDRIFMQALKPARDQQDCLDIINRVTAELRFRAALPLFYHGSDFKRYKKRLSIISDRAISHSAEVVYRELCQKQGVVPHASFTVLGLGRLGAETMHPHSDVDLIYVYDMDKNVPSQIEEVMSREMRHFSGCFNDKTETFNMTKLTPIVWFIRFSNRLTTFLTCISQYGKLFEVDLRLRPEGSSGAVVSSVERLNSYYKNDAMSWELLALIRARVVATNDPKNAQDILNGIYKNLYIKAQNLNIKNDIIEMRDRIYEHKPPRHDWDVKLLRGGLIDAEFIILYLSLKSTDKSFKTFQPSVSENIEILKDADILKPDEADLLLSSYIFLDNLLCCFRLGISEDNPPTKAPEGFWLWVSGVLNLANMQAIEEHKNESVKIIQTCYQKYFKGCE